MEVPVIIEPVTGNGYRATGAGGLSVGLTAEGTTPAEAFDRLAEQVRLRLHAGAQLTALSIAGSEAPWKVDAGCLQNDPLYEPWREAMEEHRRQLDEDPDALLVVAVASETIIRFVLTGERKDFSVTLGDFTIQPLEG